MSQILFCLVLQPRWLMNWMFQGMLFLTAEHFILIPLCNILACNKVLPVLFNLWSIPLFRNCEEIHCYSWKEITDSSLPLFWFPRLWDPLRFLAPHASIEKKNKKNKIFFLDIPFERLTEILRLFFLKLEPVNDSDNLCSQNVWRKDDTICF